jgi:hypothetical protein
MAVRRALRLGSESTTLLATTSTKRTRAALWSGPATGWT